MNEIRDVTERIKYHLQCYQEDKNPFSQLVVLALVYEVLRSIDVQDEKLYNELKRVLKEL